MSLDKTIIQSPVTTATDIDIGTVESQEHKRVPAWLSKFSAWGIEMRGITPVPLEERTDMRFINIFFVWFTMSTNLLP